VIEDPSDVKHIETVVRNVNALGVEKVYVVDSRKALPDDRQEMRETRSLSKTSVSAIEWSVVKRFDSTQAPVSSISRRSVLYR
jgi:tRNA (guanosine-2'-O-)-methyltransferase